ncbi:LysR family transcriptional regulator [Streptomyces odontomachi]|uniref:LysR family transcriptional regulator n=1 Tax=Streptomyces odontomachi TaxID=2944940 RepID=UPI00210AD4AA|nr:LysR family transcriptional regulator [Streptomyces sp. ODS25]
MPDSPLTPVDLDLRLVHGFTVVAEYRHFGRAAEVLRTTQPSLSRQIRSLEKQVGARLLDRSPRGTDLTEAGEVFLPFARALLRSADQAMARTRAAAEPGRITVGYSTNLIVTPAVSELRRRHPEADVRTLHLAFDRPRPALLDRRVDAMLTRMPLNAAGLHVIDLYREPRALMMSVGHRLADREFVTLDDFVDEPLPQGPDPHCNAFWRIDPRPDGSPAPEGPFVEDIEDKIELIASGQAVAIIPAGEHVNRLRPGLKAVALHGVEPTRVVLATRADDRNTLVAAFRRLAETHLAAPPPERQPAPA